MFHGNMREKVVVLLCYFVLALSCTQGQAHVQPCTQDMETVLSRIGTGRSLLERQNISESISALTARTVRVDPLDRFRKYKGGYNITNKHYWSSTIYTGRYGYVIGVVWLVAGLMYASVMLIMTRTCLNKGKKEEKRLPCSSRYCLWPVNFLTILVIVASGVVLGGSSNFHSRAQAIKGIISDTAEGASDTIYKVTKAVVAIQNITEVYGSFQGFEQLNSTSQKLNMEADSIRSEAEKNVRLVNKGIKTLKAVTIITIVLNLTALLALQASRFPGLFKTSNLFITFCWLFTFLLWIYFGLYFFLDKFSGDTCTALDEYRINPRNSTLSSILPCSNRHSTNMGLHNVQEGIHDLVNQVNANISLAKSLSLPDLHYVCNPFSGPPEYYYQPENCSSNTIEIGDIPQMLKRYTCSDKDGGACISASAFTQVQVYTSSIQDIVDAFPAMERLADCRLVDDAFSEILKECKPLKKYARMTWASLTALSATMVTLVLMCILEAHCEYRCHYSDIGIVKPRPASPNSLPFVRAEENSKQNQVILEP